jgi:ribosomal-protein-alanine N-acetyltransferase
MNLPAQQLDDGTVALRLIDERDLPVLERASREPEIAGRFGLSTRTAGEYLSGYVEGWSGGTAVAFAVTERGGTALGQVLLEVRESGRADVGYWLLAEARGRGLATRALRLLSNWALDQPGIVRLQLWTSPENTASAGVAERSGFKREGVLRSYAQREDGCRVDAVFFSLLRGECERGSAH